ncbi:polysaccharide deacetylase WbmS family protein [Aliarcobacter butzleri]|uniref:polysaccharide deacetylase WbmS family protein n=1 Tax=Aliarcobacter butzleri TaxID=28197 RepID=UPI0021B1C225|nr:polysaccharide deacetylase family protein [Aliarcobacter butzleri]MCT7590682.1 hypothetical protein [Aliarcobacter butzleri]
MIFENIKNVNVNNALSWENNIFLTFDIDWCTDEVLSYTLSIIEKYDIKATFFVTHKTLLLERMRANPKIELGIHPNFNLLLNGDFRYGKNIDEVVDYYMKIVPDAKSVRSHSVTQNSQILNSFEQFGLKFDSNTFIPHTSGIELKPWIYLNLIKVPYMFADDLRSYHQWSLDVNNYLKIKGIKVFDFHPIHIFLNTEHLDRYEKSRKWHNCSENLQKQKYNGFGTHSFLINLIEKGLEK